MVVRASASRILSFAHGEVMDTLQATPPTAVQPAVDFFSPISRDLEEVERILAQQLAGQRPCVAPLTAHLCGYRGKRLRPPLLLLVPHPCARMPPPHPPLAALLA